MGERYARTRKRPRPRKRAGRRVAMVAATAGMAAGGFLAGAGFLPAAGSGGHAGVTGGSASCTVQVDPLTRGAYPGVTASQGPGRAQLVPASLL
jgi:hypothetical protein